MSSTTAELAATDVDVCEFVPEASTISKLSVLSPKCEDDVGVGDVVCVGATDEGVAPLVLVFMLSEFAAMFGFLG